jgi:hypothetical protein
MKKIESIEIVPAKNGGHTVNHRFAREAKSEKMGDMYMTSPSPETQSFGAGEHAATMAHVAKSLGMKAEKGHDCPMCGGTCKA